MRSLFLIHWHPEEAEALARPLREGGWEVRTEAEDGARAYRETGAWVPDAVVVYLARLPSHGRETAVSIRQRRSTRATPILFVGGTREDVDRVRQKLPRAAFLSEADLSAALAQLLDGPPVAEGSDRGTAVG
jgi:DNA-binding response OmpR family regulator